ncbi:MAG: hypothetical protein JW892_08985 [Anaerolineae bacterium]|nr:hypothetical protein [Anaerolineae bacterium]
METVLNWLARQAVLFYAACGLGALVYVFMALAARRRAQAAQFSLEREITRQQQTRAWVMVGLFVALGLLVFAVRMLTAPEQALTPPEPPQQLAGITPVPTATATPTAIPITPAAVLTGTVVATAPGLQATATAAASAATPTVTPAPTVTPLSPLEPPNCPSPDVQITAPVAGSSVKGTVEVWGTAEINSFAYYKFEIQFQGSSTPNFIAQFERPVSSGILGYWTITAEYPVGGPHRFRLVAVDVYGNTTNCIIPVFISP